MKHTNSEIEQKLKKQASSFAIPDVREKAKAEYLAKKDLPEEKNPQVRTKGRKPLVIGLSSLALAATVVCVLFLTPVKDLIFPNTALSYDDYVLSDEDKQLASQTLLYAVYLNSDTATTTTSDTTLKLANREENPQKNTITSLYRYLPTLEIAFYSQDFNCQKTAVTSSSFSLAVDGKLLGGEELSKSMTFQQTSSTDGSVTYQGAVQVFSAPTQVQATKTKEGDKNAYNTQVSSPHGDQQGHGDDPHGNTYVLDTSNGEATITLAKKMGMNSVWLSYNSDNGQKANYLLTKNSDGTINVSSGFMGNNLDSFKITIQNDDAGDFYVITGRDFTYSFARATASI